MIEQLLLLFQALFLLLLYLFIWRVVRTASRDMRLPQESFFLAPSQVQASPVEAARSRLVVEASPALEPGRAFELGTAPLTIGRSGENAIALPSDEYASAHHARIEPLRDGVWIVDLGSTNGTYLNGEQVNGRGQLREGDVVRVGETELRIEWERSRQGGGGVVGVS
jgi:pSer/pThr/pTyr-binding forkhead associated (FHA) protein